MQPRNSLDRSLAFTALLEQSPEFARTEARQGQAIVTRLLDDFYAQDAERRIWEFTKAWLAAGKLTERPGKAGADPEPPPWMEETASQIMARATHDVTRRMADDGEDIYDRDTMRLRLRQFARAITAAAARQAGQ